MPTATLTHHLRHDSFDSTLCILLFFTCFVTYYFFGCIDGLSTGGIPDQKALRSFCYGFLFACWDGILGLLVQRCVNERLESPTAAMIPWGTAFLYSALLFEGIETWMAVLLRSLWRC